MADFFKKTFYAFGEFGVNDSLQITVVQTLNNTINFFHRFKHFFTPCFFIKYS